MKILASISVELYGNDGLSIEALRNFVKAADAKPDAFIVRNEELSDHRSIEFDLIDPSCLSSDPHLCKNRVDERVLKLLGRQYPELRRRKLPGGPESVYDWRDRVYDKLKESGYYVENGIPEFTLLRDDDHVVKTYKSYDWICIDGKKTFKIYPFVEENSYD